MNDELFQSLLNELFQGHSDRLRTLLQSLTATERKTLFNDFAELLKALQRACCYQQEAKPVTLPDLYQAIRPDPAAFLRDQAATQTAPGTLNNAHSMGPNYQRLMNFYSRLQLLHIGLAGKGGVGGAFKASSNFPIPTEHFILRAGRILLDRPEPWVLEILLRLFAEFQRWMRFSGGNNGVAILMMEVRQLHPDWSDALNLYLGKAMRWDGFFHRSLKRYDSAMILAGLEYESPTQDSGIEPLMDPEIVKSLVRGMNDGSLPRSDLVDLTLRKLQGPLRPTIAKCWIDLFNTLALTDDEVQRYADGFISLINAPAPAASKLAFEMVEKHFLQDAAKTDELVGALGYALLNPVQVLAKSALRLLKKQCKANPEFTAPILNAVIAGLSSPHAMLRADFLRWLGAFKAHDYPEEALRQLQDMATVLPAAELAPIIHLLGESPTEPATSGVTAADPCADLQEWVAIIRQRCKDHPSDSLLGKRLAFLEKYLATGQLDDLNPTITDHSSALISPDFYLHETAEALAIDIARTKQRIFSQADYDRILMGILRFAKADQSGRISAILAPVRERLEFWRQPPENGSPGWGQTAELPALLLAEVWRTARQVEFPKDSRGYQLLDMQFRPAMQRRLKHLLNLIAASCDTLLSVPTHAAGWLLPTVFAERCHALPPHLLDPEELSVALYRLPALPEQRAKAWEMLAPRLAQLDPLFADALTVALAPDTEADLIINRLLRRFEQQPPTEPLFYALFGDFSDGSLANVFRIKPVKHDPDHVNNIAFRLFNAALRCRFGLGDAGIAKRAQGLMDQLSSTRGWLHKMLHGPEMDSAILATLLFAPQPVTESLAVSLFSSFSSYFAQDTSYPFLWPYLLAHSHYFAIPNLVSDLTYCFPPLAQRLFEAGLCRQNGKNDYYRDLTLMLLAQGKLPHVDIRSHLHQAARGLSATQLGQRESGVDGLAQWLCDGRATPSDVAGILAKQIEMTDQGFASLDQAMASLCATGEAGRFTVLLALEQIVGNSVANFSPRKLSLVLDRLATILEETGRTVDDAAAQQVIKTLATAKKKTVVRDKANALAARFNGNNQPPLHILAVAALAVK